MMNYSTSGNGAFIADTEDVLAVYARQHHPDRPLVLLNEAALQFTNNMREAAGETPASHPAGSHRTTIAFAKIIDECMGTYRQGRR